jgi:hypothetical protein
VVKGGSGSGKRDKGWPAFWAAWQIIKDLGLIELIGHVIEADTAEGEPIHPYALGSGEEIERRLAEAAQKAAESMLTHDERSWRETRGWCWCRSKGTSPPSRWSASPGFATARGRRQLRRGSQSDRIWPDGFPGMKQWQRQAICNIKGNQGDFKG